MSEFFEMDHMGIPSRGTYQSRRAILMPASHLSPGRSSLRPTAKSP